VAQHVGRLAGIAYDADRMLISAGVMRHADAPYDIAIACAKEQGLKLPTISS